MIRNEKETVKNITLVGEAINQWCENFFKENLVNFAVNNLG